MWRAAFCRGADCGCAICPATTRRFYPLCILPALLLKTTAAQITAIGWLNAVYMASAVFPAYALARAMGMNRRRTAFLVGVTAVLPMMSAASTFMSETVFLPLSLWQVYFFLRAMLAEPEGPRGLVPRGGGGVLLPAVSEQGGRALLSDRLGACARVGLEWHDKASWRASWPAMPRCWAAFWSAFCWPRRRCSAGWATPTTRPAG
ncbi:MAG: hypothetical protein V8S13_09300 [Gemmiger formicilis]